MPAADCSQAVCLYLCVCFFLCFFFKRLLSLSSRVGHTAARLSWHGGSRTDYVCVHSLINSLRIDYYHRCLGSPGSIRGAALRGSVVVPADVKLVCCKVTGILCNGSLAPCLAYLFPLVHFRTGMRRSWGKLTSQLCISIGVIVEEKEKSLECLNDKNRTSTFFVVSHQQIVLWSFRLLETRKMIGIFGPL